MEGESWIASSWYCQVSGANSNVYGLGHSDSQPFDYSSTKSYYQLQQSTKFGQTGLKLVERHS